MKWGSKKDERSDEKWKGEVEIMWEVEGGEWERRYEEEKEGREGKERKEMTEGQGDVEEKGRWRGERNRGRGGVRIAFYSYHRSSQLSTTLL